MKKDGTRMELSADGLKVRYFLDAFDYKPGEVGDFEVDCMTYLAHQITRVLANLESINNRQHWENVERLRGRGLV